MRILVYHEVVQNEPPEIHAVTKAQFAAQMAWLDQSGYQVVPLIEILAPDSRSPRSVAITFDDGYLDTATRAWPILQERGFSGTVFLATGMLGGHSTWRPGLLGGAPLLTWAQVRALADEGLAFGSHTVTHCDLTGIDAGRCAGELRDSRAQMEQVLGAPAVTFSYPYSRFGEATKKMAREAGYRLACSCPAGYTGQAGRDMYDLQRVTVLASDRLADFIGKLGGSPGKRLAWYRRELGRWRRRLLAGKR